MEPVAIIGTSQTVHEESKSDLNYAELVHEAVRDLMQRLSISTSDIDTVISASSDFSDGRTISNMAIQDVVGVPLKSESKVSMDGAFALQYGYARVASGEFETALVVAHAKLSEGNPRLIANAAWDPLYLRPLGLDDHAAMGLQARAYLERYQLKEEILTQAAARAYAASARNPFAHRRTGMSQRRIAGSGLRADPLRALHLAPESDGACAVLLASEERAARFSPRKVWLKGTGSCYDAHAPGGRDLSQSEALRHAARRAYDQAGIADPAGELAVAEVMDLSSCQSMLWAEELGFCPRGSGGSWILAGPKPEYNRSGGALGAHPGFATGLVRIAEVANRLVALSGDAGGRLMAGLAHGMTGAIGQAHCVWILST